MISYKTTSPEEKVNRRRLYQERKLKASEESVKVNSDGSVNIEYWIYERCLEMDWSACTHEDKLEALKVMCERYSADLERVKLYLLFS